MATGITTDKVNRRTLAFIVLGAVILRAIWAVLVPVIPISDGEAYAAFARTLAEHHVFGWTKDEPFAFWPPGTTLLHALAYKIFGPHYAGIVTLNIALSAGLIVTSTRVAERMFGARVGLVTALLLAIWPTLVVYPTIFASEIPFLFFTILALDVWTSGAKSALYRGILAGLLLGFAALIRPLALLLPIVYAISVLFQFGMGREKILHQLQLGVLALVAMMAVVAPWAWRNYQLFDDVVLISTNGGITLWMGNAPNTDGSYLPVPDELAHLPDSQQSEILGARAKQYILDDPAAFLSRSVRKLFLLYSNESIGILWNQQGIEATFGPSVTTPLKRFTQATWGLLLLLAIGGFVVDAYRRGLVHAALSPTVATIAFYSAVYAVTVAQDRYHLSFASQIAILGAIGATALYDAWKNRNPSSVSATV